LAVLRRILRILRFGHFAAHSALWAFCGAFCALGVFWRILRFGRFFGAFCALDVLRRIPRFGCFAAHSALWAFLQNLIIYA
jgi:hypothetical protein